VPVTFDSDVFINALNGGVVNPLRWFDTLAPDATEQAGTAQGTLVSVGISGSASVFETLRTMVERSLSVDYVTIWRRFRDMRRNYTAAASRISA
jgi:hypothetical protein